jgi:hypothetical protein
MTNGKGLERKQSWPNSGVITGIRLGGLRKPTKNLIQDSLQAQT